MAKNSADYWRDREAAQRKKDIVDQLAYNREIRRIYQSTLDNVQKEIDAFYGKYAKKEGITLAEAKRRVSRLDMEAYERKAKRYVKERDFSPQANEEMRLYNLTMKVNRLEMLKANIGLELIRGFDDLNKTFDEKLTRHATGEFERLAGILGDSVRNNSELAHAIVNASFHNATYSDRIWAYQDLLRDEIGKQVQTGLLQGRNSMELARAVQKRFDVSRSDAERLMMTEMRRVRTEVAKQSYEQNGNTEYQFLALGGNPCNDCADLDGRVFPVKEMMPGTNAPPMHPRCLCSTAPYWDEAKFQEWLDSGAAADGVPWEEFEGEARGESEESRKVTQGEYGVNWPVVQSAEYRRALETIFEDPKVVDAIQTRAKWALSNRDGKSTEELYAISLSNSERREIARITNQNNPFGVMRTQEFTSKLNKADKMKESILLLHNHPRGMPPSISDINILMENKNIAGITIGHDGSIYYYTRPLKKILKSDFAIASSHYSRYSEITATEKALEDLSVKFGFTVIKLR